MTRPCSEPNGMRTWCKKNCAERNEWGSYNLTTAESYYPSWYKTVVAAVVSVDSQLQVWTRACDATAVL